MNMSITIILIVDISILNLMCPFVQVLISDVCFAGRTALNPDNFILSPLFCAF